MNVQQCHGIVLASSVYKEADKIITLLTAEKGIMQAVVKGALKPKAKQAYLAQPFCFAQFEYVQKGGFATITGATEVQLFPELMQDLQVYVYGSMALEVAKIVGLENVPQPELFVQLVTAIAKLAKQENVTITMVTYFRHVLEISGYALQIFPTKGAEHYAFTYHNGEIKAQSNGAFSRNQVMALSGYSAKLTLTEEQSLLKNLIQYFEEKTATKLKSIQGYELF